MDKIAAYEMLLSQHPLWQKTASAPSLLLPAGGAAIGGALGGVGGYFSTDDKEKRKKRAVIGAITGGALGGIGGEAVRRFRAVKPSLPELPPPHPTLNNIPLKTKFVHDALDKHREDYLRYETGLLGVKHRLTPDEVRGLLGGMEIRDAAPTLSLAGEGAPEWRAGEIAEIIGKYQGFNVPPGGSLVDARASRGARDAARAEAQKRVNEFLASRQVSVEV